MKRKRKKSNVWLKLSILILLVVSGFSYVFYRTLVKTVPGEREIFVTIEKNSSISHIVKTLNKYGIFEPDWLFVPLAKIYMELTGSKVYIGKYRFTPENTNLDILRAMFSGKQLSIVKVVFPEGIQLTDFASIAKRKLNIDSSEFIKLCYDESIIKANQIPSNSIEGYLMPDTYEFFWEEKPINVINRLLQEHHRVWQSNFSEGAKKSGYTKHQILTLASIIEAETRVPDERARVSGVYHNRLRLNWNLESDPTVQYAIGKRKRLTYTDLELKNPYNTYIYKGLPPGPINSPSKSSIFAALNPEQHNYLFFVAVGDDSGAHKFSTNYNQHLRFKSQFKKNQRNDSAE